MYRDTIFQYVKKQYGTIPEYLWNDLPDSAILRNDNGKWYAVFMNLEGFKIGLDTKDRVATVYKGNIIKNLIMDCQSYTKYRPNETTGGIFVSWRRKEELPTGA